jgi:hypothetical protein
MDKIDMNAPAFGGNAQKAETVAPTSDTEVKPVADSSEEEEESKVPYSRFKKFHDQARENEKEAQYWREQAESLRTREPKETPTDYQSKALDLWIENYGDTEASRKAFRNQQEINRIEREEYRAELKREALEAVRNERYQETRQTEENLEVIDDNIDSLKEYLGRSITSREESALLDIIDDYTPKDDDGNYAGPLISMDKAWKIYQMQTKSSKSSDVNSRDGIASITGSQSYGETNITEADKNFNPLERGTWKKRLGL